ncbi:MAG: sulfotransferase [Candidatus Jettenia sp.]|uniref:Sulfotransferase n=1 Tax=Candidatus Brocadia sinica JPN1 TaxID=1197129 RepID=A0ABQ0JS34_9BACT|nr:sulfotransferase [Candidatus Brocadia sinica]KAA0241434.1 MAG: sulfotransferase [Candidatus Brocadia sp. AMX2]MBC6930533.1 sulfotransferase [Candidatus Jettenia sp.]MBL1170644.1 sulfotransferase [Candidatus Brocadia sp. AMX1]NOG43135.1 sulfotransferase [Planctomycetota bacterium]MCQ3928675.1 sulfotransferase [Candidatus Jettenia sp.]
MKGKLPNFLIVGAAKSGTTSLYYCLKQHPEVFMSPNKEPRFITAQFVKFPLKGIKDWKIERKIIKNFDEYKKLFSKVSYEKAIGEASVDNLYFYVNAIKYIKEYLGEVKIIIILRNPIERTFSHYMMLRRDLREYLSFEDALKAEDERKRKNWGYGWHYQSVSLYYEQVKAYLENFNQVKVCLYDDLKSNPIGLAKDIYSFLGIDSSFIPDMSIKYNVSGIPRNKFVKIVCNFLRKPTKPTLRNSIITQICKVFLIEKKRVKFVEYLDTKNLKKIEMKPEMREYLKGLFREDILQLQDLLHRDLSHWIEAKKMKEHNSPFKSALSG